MFQHNAERLLRLIERVYRWLPLGTVVNNKVLVVHGGISDVTDLDWVRNLDRHKVGAAQFLGEFIKG
jgi:serine/threonine-protein phosphatase with EF-hand domain